jgi:hypothetical protein
MWAGDEADGWIKMTGTAFDVLLDAEEYISVKVFLLQDLQTKTPFINNVMKEGIKIA